MKTTLLKFTSMLLLFFGIEQYSIAQFKVIGYAPSWSQTTIQYSKLTHINYAFAIPQYGGGIQAIDNASYLQSIVSNAHANGVKVFISIGGWSSNGVVLAPVFESIGGNQGAISNLVSSALGIVNAYNLDGVDIDWEYPTAGTSSNNYTNMISQLSSALRANGKGISIAVAADSYNTTGISSAVFQYVDHVNIMAYDNTSQANHSTYQFAVSSVSLLEGLGCPAKKCVLGVPFYAQPSLNSYATLLAEGANPNSDFFGSDGYNGIPTIQQKTQFALSNAGGIMMWDLAQDAQGTYSLLSAINSTVVAANNNSNNNNNNNNTTTNSTGTVIQAENYNNMFGVQTENTTDAGGGLDVGWIDAGDWMAYYNVNFPTTGAYTISYRVASLSGGGVLSCDLNAGSIQLGTVNVPSTGGWQNWTTITQTVTVNAGTYNFGINAHVGGWNINWFEITPAAPPAQVIQAENYNNMYNVQTEATTDAGGGLDVGYINAGSWMAYYNINFPVTGAYLVSYRVASLNGGGSLSCDLNAGSIQLGAISIPSTGGWQNWTTVTQTIQVTAGTYNFGIFAQAGGWNINWFSIAQISGAKMGLLDPQNTSLITTDYNLSDDFTISPNPVIQEFTIVAPDVLTGGSIEVINELGTVVLKNNFDNTSVNVSNLPSGIYTLIFNKDGNKIVKRFIKQ